MKGLDTVICVKRTTRQRVVAEVGADLKSRGCEAAGLSVNPGDRVRTCLFGEANGSALNKAALCCTALDSRILMAEVD